MIINLSIQNEDVNVLTGSDYMVKTTVTDIVRSTVTTDNPLAAFNKILLQSQSKQSQSKQLQSLQSQSPLSQSSLQQESQSQPVIPEMSPNDRKFMDKLVELMEQNMDNGELVVDDLVRELAVSRSVFFKKLKTLTGLAPIEFIKEMRIKRAAQLIETGEFNMTQISYMVGINDPRYFSKCFKAQVGMTPTEYKEKVGV